MARQHQVKLRQTYEFGCKVVLVTTHASNWIVAIDAVHGNPYDGATLKGALRQTERLTAISPQPASVDQGFRGTTHPRVLTRTATALNESLQAKLK